MRNPLGFESCAAQDARARVETGLDGRPRGPTVKPRSAATRSQGTTGKIPGKATASLLRRVKQRTDLLGSAHPGSKTGNFMVRVTNRDAFSLTDGAGQGEPRESVVNTGLGLDSRGRKENGTACRPKPDRKSCAITITAPGSIYCDTKTQSEAAKGLDSRFSDLWSASADRGMS